MLPLVALLVIQQPGLVLPVGAAPHLANLNLIVQKSLQSGDFATAEKQFAEWPNGKLQYSLQSPPAAYVDAAAGASALVKEATHGRTEFVSGSNPRVVFTFAGLPPEGPKEPMWRD